MADNAPKARNKNGVKRNDGDLPVPLEGLADAPVTRARAIKLFGATAAAGAFAAFTGGTA